MSRLTDAGRSGSEPDAVLLELEVTVPDRDRSSRRMVSDGELPVSEGFLQDSERRIELYGQKK